MNKVTTPSTWTELNNIINSEPTDTYIALDELQDYIDSGELSYFDGLMAHGKAISSDTSLGVKTQNCVVGTDAELENDEIHLTDMVGVGGWTNYEAILMSIMNAVGIKVKDANVGDNIHDAFETIDQEYLDKYISMLKDVHSGDKYILYYNDKTYIRLQAFGMLINEFINDGIFSGGSEYQPPIDPTEMVVGQFYSVSPMSKSDFKTFLLSLDSKTFPVKHYNLAYGKDETYYIEITGNDFASAFDFIKDQIPDDALLSASNFDVGITINNNTSTITKLDKYITLQYQVGNNGSTNFYAGKYEDVTTSFNSEITLTTINSNILIKTNDTNIRTTYFIVKNASSINKTDFFVSNSSSILTPRINRPLLSGYSKTLIGYGFHIGSGKITQSVEIQGIELMSDAVKLDVGWDIATDFPTWESNKLLLHGYINEQLYELEHYPIRYDATKIVSDTLANAQDGVSDYDKIAIDKGKDDAKEQGAIIPTEPTTPTTPTPIILPPSTDVIGMYRIYNPTPSQLQSITNFLWNKSEGEGGSFFDNVTKLFQDPMQCIIGLSRVYAPVSVGGTEQFTIGKVTVPTSWLSLPVNTTSSQYSEVDMGSVAIKEYFGDVRDYDGYTQIQIYLPFIGFRQLKTNDVMGGTIHLTYYVDILTGNCNAKIDVSRKNMVRQCLYTFDGNCSEQIPVSGSNYTNLISSTLMGMISGAGTGGQIGAVVGGATSLMSGMSNNVQRSGSISGSLGAINIKKPYLIISRPIPADANTFNTFYGYPANKTIRLGNCSGYTKVKSVHVEGIICTDEEKNMIESQLKQGVLV